MPGARLSCCFDCEWWTENEHLVGRRVSPGRIGWAGSAMPSRTTPPHHMSPRDIVASTAMPVVQRHPLKSASLQSVNVTAVLVGDGQHSFGEP
jgi:hypothetical protein